MAFEIKTSTRHYQLIEYGEINCGIVSLYKIAEILNEEIREILP
jgi:hypothetical protein